jgi:hypothetical protein
MTPSWILGIAGALVLVVAAVSAARLVAARPWRQGSVVLDADVAHLLMGIAMAGMFTSSLRTLPSTAWEVIFGLMTVWFAVRVILDSQTNGVRALAGGHCAPHLVHSAAMLYMFLAMNMPAAGMSGSGMGGMGGMSGGSASMTLDHPTIAFVFALVLAGYTIWDLDQLSGRRYSLGTARVSLAGVGAVGVPAMAASASGSGSGSGALADTQSADSEAGAGSQSQAAVSQAISCDRGADGRGVGGSGGVLLSPAVTVGCRIMMGVAMVFMLVIAI